MPSLKMKTKSTTGCFKEKKGLQVCRRSSMISKNPLSHAIVSQNVEKICAHCNQDAPVYGQIYAQDLEVGEAIHELSTEEKLLQEQPIRVIESANENMEPILPTCTSNIETIFSPILESICNNDGSDSLYVPLLDSEDSDDSSKNSCKYQTSNVSDFYISDMIFSASPIGGNSDYCSSRTDSIFLPDYPFDESSLLCDLTEEYMVLPFLEDTLDNTGLDNGVTCSTKTNSSSFYMAIHQLRSCDPDYQVNSCSYQDHESLDPQLYIRNLPEMEFPVPVPNNKESNKQITLVLDLDETLVHSTLEHCDDADFTFLVTLDTKECTVYVKQRPHLMTFLQRVAEMFEIVVFTASQSIYAKQLLDILDPDGKVISRRAYRESCTVSEGTYVKDLTILGVDLAKVAIIDNSPQVFRLQVNNGIPIKSWFNDPSDTALISLLPFLETLVDTDDVRPIIARKFGNKE
ncbi:CTD small phosphatase-like protein [Striga asiatica]|uniref:CTD small phosphatase-like protein n=1 Tax=Striga asiatica TaxID=4170 RepID=A0A5A7NWC2_STRAF|nr:CTD small phosphatase-like protein [Striga asiatica]